MVTVTSTGPTDPAGEVAVMVVELTTVKVAVAVPNFTPVTQLKPVPVMVTEVPPPVGPVFGTTPVTVGTALMSGPVAPHLLSPRVMTSPGDAAPRTVMISASLVIEVDPGAFLMVCTLASIEMSGARGPRPVSTAFGVVGTGTTVPAMVRRCSLARWPE